MDTSIKFIAQQLRRNGDSLGSIVKQTGLPRSTIYGWIREVKLSSSAAERLKENKAELLAESRLKSVQTYAKRRQNAKIVATEGAKSIVALLPSLFSVDMLVLSMLYWCEGGKNTKYGMHFINSDPVMVNLFMQKLRSCFVISEDKLRIMLHVHEYHNTAELIAYWANICDVNKNAFFKPYLKQNTSIRKKPNYMGCVSIRYQDKKLADLLTMVYTEYAQQHKS